MKKSEERFNANKDNLFSLLNNLYISLDTLMKQNTEIKAMIMQTQFKIRDLIWLIETTKQEKQNSKKD